ncbi:MAG: DUF697 domain-containing protein [Cyanobacteria bacterium P01_F01_bin.150]
MIAKLQEKLLKPEFLLKKPFIAGGVGLTLGVALWHTAVPSVADMLGMAGWSAIALGAGTWWLSRRDSPSIAPLPTVSSSVTRETVEATLAGLRSYLQEFATAVTEASANHSYQDAIAQFQQQHRQLLDNLDRTQLQCSVVGMKGVGKTSIVEQLNALDIHSFSSNLSVESASLAFCEDNVLSQAPAQQAKDTSEHINVQGISQNLCLNNVGTDLIVFVSEGDLTATELTFAQELLNHSHTLLMAFNKQDRYLPTERLDILNQIRDRFKNQQINAERFVSTSAIATRIKVRQHQPDGSIVERFDETPADVTSLLSQIQALLANDAEVLIWKTTLRQAHQLRSEVRGQWNQLKRDRALPIIEKYQWLAAATAFANPIPSLDLVATGAINAQLLADLGAMYDRPLALNQAQIATRTIAELMVKLGLVELATQTIASLLKTHVLTFAAGGIAQGLSAAYLTHIAGQSLIQYFEEQDSGDSNPQNGWNLERLGQIMQQLTQRYQRGQFVQTLVEQGIGKLSQQSQSKSTSPAVS